MPLYLVKSTPGNIDLAQYPHHFAKKDASDR
jgi:hypothetical protein